MHHSNVEELLRDWEVSACGIPSNNHTQSRRVSTIFFLETLLFWVYAENAIAIVIQGWIASFSTRVGVGIELVAISAPPVVASESADIRKGVIIKIEGGKMLISEMVSEEMDQPFPRRGGYQAVVASLAVELGDGFLELGGRTLVDYFALRIFAHAWGVADHVWVLFVQETFDYVRACVVGEGFAGRLDESTKHRAKLVLNEAGDIFSMIDNIVLHNSGDDSTKRALIVKAVIGVKSLEIGIGAFLGQIEQTRVDLLINLNPIRHVEHADQFMQHLVAAAHRGHLVFWVQDLELAVERLRLECHFHEGWEYAACVARFVVAFDALDVFEEVFEDVAGRQQRKQEAERDELQ